MTQVEEPTVRTVMDTLESVRGYPSGRYAAEAKGVKQMLRQGYSMQEILDCYEHLKKNHFWDGKELTMMTVAGQIGAWKQWATRHTADERDGQQATEDHQEARAYFFELERLRGVELTTMQLLSVNHWKEAHPNWTPNNRYG